MSKKKDWSVDEELALRGKFKSAALLIAGLPLVAASLAVIGFGQIVDRMREGEETTRMSEKELREWDKQRRKKAAKAQNPSK